MKTLLGILALGVVLQVSCFAQLVRITQSGRTGTLTWSNALCTTTPIYQIVRSSSVTGPWTHVAYVTNQTTYNILNVIPSGNSAFYRVAWTNDTPVVMEYVYYEDDFPAVIGELTLNFASLRASWSFEDTGLSSGIHPVGAGSGPIGFTSDLRTWAIILRQSFDDSVFISGSLQSSSTGSGCEYSAYSGLAYWVTSFGTEMIGDFVALKQ